MKKSFTILLIYLAFSCAPLTIPITVPLKTVEFKFTDLNKTISKEIGETLIQQGMKCESDAILIEEIPRAMAYNNLRYKSGDIIPLKLIYKGYKLYSEENGYLNGIAISLKYGYAYPYKFTSMENFQLIMDKEKIKFKEEFQEIKCDKSFKQQFIFNGKVGNSLKFTYREFINDYARPAFSQDLQYDLSESNIIGFKGLRIEVIKATNTNIEYKVLNPFN